VLDACGHPGRAAEGYRVRMLQDGPAKASPAVRRPAISAPTVHDVARHAGVSSMTVSRVLSGAVHVRPELRSRVEASIEVLGYRRNENARSIRPGQRTGLIGVAITNIANPYYAEVLLGIEEVAGQSDRRILVGNSGEDSAREAQLIRDFVGRQVEGLVVVPAGGDAGHFTRAALGPIPLVLASRSLPGVQADVVLVDDVAGARAGTLRLLDAGHRRIAFLGNIPSVSTAVRRYEGFRLAHAERGLTPDDALVRMGQQDAAAARTAMTELLDLAQPPTAVFTSNNRNTIGALRALLERAVDPPLPLVGFDNFDLSDLVPYPLTIIDHDARELGRTAARLLMARLVDPDAPPRTLAVPTTVLG